MATKKVCDRCNKEEMSHNTDIRQVDVLLGATTRHDDNGERISNDLCGSCVKAFKEFLKPLPVMRG